MNNLKLADTQSSPAEHFRRKLIEISPFLKKMVEEIAGFIECYFGHQSKNSTRK